MCIEVELGLLIRGPTSLEGPLAIEIRGLASILSISLASYLASLLPLMDSLRWHSLLNDPLRRLRIGILAMGVIALVLRR